MHRTQHSSDNSTVTKGKSFQEYQTRQQSEECVVIEMDIGPNFNNFGTGNTLQQDEEQIMISPRRAVIFRESEWERGVRWLVIWCTIWMMGVRNQSTHVDHNHPVIRTCRDHYIWWMESILRETKGNLVSPGQSRATTLPPQPKPAIIKQEPRD